MSDTRERIRDAGLKLFIEKGYRGTSIADIERAAGLAPRAGGFYRHFPSKEDLVVEIGEKSIIETREDLGFTGALPLGDTRAELVLIAKGYAKAAARQAPLANLIAEVQRLEKVRALEDRVSKDLFEALTGWLADKPIARGKDRTRLVALLITIFGGWIFYLTKRGSPVTPELTDQRMIEEWAGTWARILDGPPSGA
jgi:AcrR family transcriptional regulator